MRLHLLLAGLILLIGTGSLITVDDGFIRGEDGSVTFPAGTFSESLMDRLFGRGPSPTIEHVVWAAEQDTDTSASTATWQSYSWSEPRPGVYVVRPREETFSTEVISELWKATGDFLSAVFSFDWLIGRAKATVALDVFNIGALGTGTLSWTHTPSGTARGVVVICQSGNTADSFNAVTYGSATLTDVSGSPNVLAAGEGGNVSVFFVGTGIPTGAQTVTITVNDATSKRCVSYTLTSAAVDTEVVDSDGTINSAAQANPSVTLTLSSRTSWAAIGIYSGVQAPADITPLASWNSRVEDDLGTDNIAGYSYDTVASTDVTCGWTQASNDAVGVCVAISEVAAACGTNRYWIGNTGNWSTSAEWADASAGPGPCAAPTASNPVFFDIASCTAACTITVDVNAAMASIDTTGFNDATSTLAVGTNNFAVSGAITFSVSQLLVTMGASAAAGLTSTSTLTLSGGAIECGTAACIADIDSDVSISAAGSYIDFGSGAWTLNGAWTNASTSASWDAGTNTVTFDDATAGTMTFAGANLAEAEFNSVTFNSTAGTAQTFTMATRGLRWLTTLTISDSSSTTALASADLALGAATDAAAVTVGNGGTLTANASTVLVNGVTMTGGTSGIITVTTGAWTVSGSWNTSGASSTYTQGTGIVTFDATATITMLSSDNTFDDLTVSAGTATLASALIITNTFIISGGTVVKGTNALTSVGALTMSGGDLTSTSGNVVVTGAVNISSALSAIDFGSETWTASGTWTNASTDATWDAGTGSILFDSATGGTMTFAGANLSEAEFDDVTFTSSAGTPQTFTMATRGLRWLTTLTISDSSSTTALATADLAIGATADVPDLVVGNGGILTANNSIGRFSSVTMTGGTNGTITLSTTGQWDVAANWNTSGAGSTFTQSTASITFNPAVSSTITLLSSDNAFGSVVIATGTVTLATNLVVDVDLTLSSGTFAKSTFTLTVTDDLFGSGGDLTSTSGAATITDDVNISDATTSFDLGSESWDIGGQYTNGSTDANWDAGTGTVTFSDALSESHTFAGANLSEAEFNNLTFTSSAGTAQTFTIITRAPRWLSALTISDTVSTTTLATSNLAMGNVADTPTLVVGNAGLFTANASTVLVVSVTMTGGVSGTITVTTGAWTVSGDWNTSGVGSTYTQGTGIVTFDATATITMLAADNTFDDLTISAGTVTLASAVIVTNGLIISGGTLAKSTFALTSVGSLTMSGGDLTSTSGNSAVTGAVNVSSTASAIDFGSETWTISGTWTNSSTDATWDAGTGTVTFDAATGGAMTFAGSNLAEAEFNNATFASTGATAQTFTVTTRAPRWLTTLTVSDTVSTTALATSDLAFGNSSDTSDLVVGNGGILTANASTTTLSSVTMTGGSSGTITVTTGIWSLAGSWNTSGVGSVFTQGTTSTYTFTATATITLLSTDNTFSTLTSNPGAATVTLASSMVVTSTFTITTGTFAKGTNTITAGALTMDGGDLTSASGNVVITGAVNISSTASAIDFGSETWTVSGIWTNATTDATWDAGSGTMTFDSPTGGTMTFAGANLSEAEFNNVTFSAVSAQTFTMSTRGLRTNGALTVTSTSGGAILAKGALTLTVGDIILSGVGGGAITSTSGDVTSTAIDISALSYIDFGSESWVVSGSWTNATVSVSWDAGTGAMTFDTGGTMTFAGSNLSEAEFNSVTFNSIAAAPDTFTMATRGLRWLTTLTVSDTISTTTLVTTGLALGAAADTADLAIGDSGLLTASTSTVIVSTVTSLGLSSGTLSITSGLWTVSGDWNTSTAGFVFTQGTSTVTFNATAAITLLASDNSFFNLTISAGTASPGSNIDVDGALIISGGTYAKTTTTLNVDGTTTMSGGDLTSTSGAVTLVGITISAASAIDFGSEAWTVSGTWTNSSTDSAGWEAGTGTVTFNSATGGSMTFAGSNLSESELNNVTFNSTAATPQTFTLLLRDLTISGTFTASDSTSTTTVDFGFALPTPNLNAAAVTISTNGIVEATSAVFTVSGNWDSSTGTFNEGSSSVVLTATGSVNGETFWALTVSGGIRTTSGNMVADTFDITAGTYASGAFDVTFTNYIDINGGTMTMDGFSVTAIRISPSAGTIAWTDTTLWTAADGSEDLQWTMNPSSAGATITVTARQLQTGTDYILNRDAIEIDRETAAAGEVTFSVVGGWSPHAMQITTAPGGDEPGPGPGDDGDDCPPNCPKPADNLKFIIIFMLIIAILFSGSKLRRITRKL
jgi:hypothetical protein